LAAVLGGENAVFRPEFWGAKNSLSLKMPGTASVYGGKNADVTRL
jgi:hypothetical protein